MRGTLQFALLSLFRARRMTTCIVRHARLLLSGPIMCGTDSTLQQFKIVGKASLPLEQWLRTQMHHDVCDAEKGKEASSHGPCRDTSSWPDRLIMTQMSLRLLPVVQEKWCFELILKKIFCFVVVILTVTLLPFAVYLPDDGGQV